MKHLSRRGVILTVLLVGFLTVVANADPALAKNNTISQVISVFDATDSHGVRLSQYQLDPNMGNMVTSPWKMILATILNFAWVGYLMVIGVVGWAADTTFSMSWVTVITGPLDDANHHIHDSVLAPLGGTSLAMAGIMGLLFSICALNGVLKLRRGGLASALMIWAAGGLAAALAIGALAFPVATFVGTSTTVAAPLSAARDASQSLASIAGGFTTPTQNQNNAGKDAGKDTGDGQAADKPISAMLIATLVRPAHQETGYGAIIDGQKCSNGSDAAAAYDKALKDGPNLDPASSDQRDAIGKCKKEWKDYANGLNFTWFAPTSLFGIAGIVVSILVGTVIVQIWLAVITMAISAFMAAYHALLAIVSPSAWSSLARDGLEIVLGVVAVVKKAVLLIIILLMVRTVLGATDLLGLPFPARFLLADLLMVAGVVFFLIDWMRDHQLRDRILSKISSRLGGGTSHKMRDILTGAGGAELLREANHHRHQAQKRRASARSNSNGQPSQDGAVQGPVATSTARTGARKAVTASAKAATSKAITAGAAASTGGTSSVALTAAKLGKRYTAIRHGQATHGVGALVLPMAYSHNAVESTRNRIHNRVDELRAKATDQYATARHQPNHADTPSTGSSRLDKTLTTAGRATAAVEKHREEVRDVFTTARHPHLKHRDDEEPTTGSTKLDKTLTTAGKTVGTAERTYNKPRTITPPVARATTRPGTPQRSAETPRRAPARPTTEPTNQPSPAVRPIERTTRTPVQRP